MEPTNTTDAIDDFVLELLRVGYMLTGLAADLAETLSPEAYPGEDPAAVVIEMITGTIRTALTEVGEEAVESAVELIREAAERVIEHLRLALALSRRMEDDRGTPRGFG